MLNKDSMFKKIQRLEQEIADADSRLILASATISGVRSKLNKYKDATLVQRLKYLVWGKL